MIVAKVEIWDKGDPDKAEPLGIILIANVGQVPGSDPDHCEYQVELQDARVARRTGRRITHWRRRGWKTLLKRAVEEVL